MSRLKSELDDLWKSGGSREMLVFMERLSFEDFHQLLGELEPTEPLDIHMIMMLILVHEVTPRTKAIMENFLRNGADPLFKTPNYRRLTLAGSAFEKSDAQLATMFLKYLVDINAPLDRSGRRAIHIITKYQDESFLSFFLSYYPDLDIQDKRGQTALHVAVQERDYSKTRTLIDAGANVDIPDRNGNTPIHCILSDAVGDESIALLLLNVADVKCKNEFGDTPLHLVMEFYKPYFLQMLEILFDKGADPWEPNDVGNTPINRLPRCRSFLEKCPGSETGLEIIKKILERGASVNRTDCFGDTILHIIANVDFAYDIFQDGLIFLLENGADPNLVNNRHKTVLDIYRGTNPLRGLFVIKYLVQKSFANKFQFGHQLLKSIESDKVYAEFFNLCKDELSNFACRSFRTPKPFTLLDVLTVTSTELLVRYVRNWDLKKTMADFDVTIYPAYGYELKEKFILGVKRYEAEMTANEYLLSGGLMNYECMESIVKFLPIEELKKIVSS